MEFTLSSELETVFAQAEDIARQVDQPLSSAHVLLALFVADSLAASFLSDQRVTVDDLLVHVRDFEPEPEDMLERIYLRGRRIAEGSRAEDYNSLHLLAAVLRETDSQAHRVLSLSSIDIATVRATIMGYATGAARLSRHPRTDPSDEQADADDQAHQHSGHRSDRRNARVADVQFGAAEHLDREEAPSPIEFHPSLGLGLAQRDDTRGEDSSKGPESATRTRRRRPGSNTSVDLESPADDTGDDSGQPSSSRSSGRSSGRSNRRSSRSGRNRRSDRTRRSTPTQAAPSTPPDREDGARDESSNDGEADETPGTRTQPAVGTPREPGKDSGQSEVDPSEVGQSDANQSDTHDASEPDAADPAAAPEALEDAQETARSLGDRLFQDSTADASENAEDAGDEASSAVDDASDAAEISEAPAGLGDEATSPAAFDGEATYVWDSAIAEEFELDEERFPTLWEFGRNLTYEAALGEIDPVIGRKREILQLIDIVGKRRSNNPMLVGEPGVGKTAIAEGLAREFVRMASEGNRRGQRIIVELELGRLLSGTQLRGSLSERLLGIKDEVAEADGDVIVFLDEVHAWLDAGGSDGGDASGELKTAMARGKFPCIGATTNEEFRKFVEGDPAFQRRFQVVLVEEPDPKTAVRILDGVRNHYEKHHGVAYSDDGLEAAVRLSRRYIHDRRLPDKAIGVLDLAGSRAARTGNSDIGRREIARVVAETAGLPVDRLTRDDRERFLRIDDALREELVGQRHAIDSISEVVRRNYAGFRGHRPIGSLLFLGPTGVGKTETVKVLADFLFHDRDAVVQVDMSEYMKSHSVSRFVGAPPGYVGHDQGGQLTEAVRKRPYRVVLLDEIEKAHPEVLNVLLQVFEEGRLTDGKGREVDFSNTLIVMTSNLGAEVFEGRLAPSSTRSIGFGAAGGSDSEAGGACRGGRDDLHEATDDVLQAARDHFTPELWNRIDEKLVFQPLERGEIAEIAELQLRESTRRIHDETGIELSVDEDVIQHLIDNGGWDPELGARPMRQTIQRLVENEVARVILEENLDRGDSVRVECIDDEVVCTPTSGV